jgi:hypothetical protein
MQESGEGKVLKQRRGMETKSLRDRSDTYKLFGKKCHIHI